MLRADAMLTSCSGLSPPNTSPTRIRLEMDSLTLDDMAAELYPLHARRDQFDHEKASSKSWLHLVLLSAGAWPPPTGASPTRSGRSPRIGRSPRRATERSEVQW